MEIEFNGWLTRALDLDDLDRRAARSERPRRPVRVILVPRLDATAFVYYLASRRPHLGVIGPTRTLLRTPDRNRHLDRL